MCKGRLITFEGGEGSGKSTQIRKLTDFLVDKGLDVIMTKQPGGGHGLQQLRAILLHQNKKDAVAELFLMLADRAQHCGEVIKPALDQGKWVLCDRFIDSTTVYQGISLGGIVNLSYLNKVATGGLEPDTTFLLNIDYKIGLDRVNKRGEKDRFENEFMGFHKRVQEDYLNLFTITKRMIYVDANNTESVVFERIRKEIIQRYMDHAK